MVPKLRTDSSAANPDPAKYRWLVLVLAAGTNTFVSAIPSNCMPVLFPEIASDLRLSIVQIGSVWGIVNLAGVFVSILAGVLGDRFGARRLIAIFCVLVGIVGALRGLSNSFLTLMIMMFAFGLVRAMLPINTTRMVGSWFSSRQLGLANGIISMGMGLGLMLGPAVSATVVSPLLGGWRNVLFLYGGISILVGLGWLFMRRDPPAPEPVSGDTAAAGRPPVSFRASFSRIIRMKPVWFLALILMFRSGAISGMTGYLPLYLSQRGWDAASADNTLTVFFAASALLVIPLSSLSDRLRSRKVILFPALIANTISLGLLPFANGAAVWVLVIASGMFMDAFMSVFMTSIFETKGLAREDIGTALGLVFTVSGLGGFIAPPLGNSFASVNTGLPFIVWMVFSVLAIVTLVLHRETR